MRWLLVDGIYRKTTCVAFVRYTSTELVLHANTQAMTAVYVSTYTRYEMYADHIYNSIWQMRTQLPYGEQSYNSR